MAAGGSRIDVRVDDALLARIDDEARARGMSRSQIVRVLLGAGLENPAATTLLNELELQVTELRLEMIRRLGAELRDRTPAILDDMIESEESLARAVASG